MIARSFSGFAYRWQRTCQGRQPEEARKPIIPKSVSQSFCASLQSLSYRIVEIFIRCSLLEFPPNLISKTAIGVFTDLESENGGLNELEGLAVDLDYSNSLANQFLLSLPALLNLSKAKRTQALAGLSNGDSGGRPLLAEASDALGGGRHGREGCCLSLGESLTRGFRATRSLAS